MVLLKKLGILTLLLALCAALLCGCGGTAQEDTETETEEAAQTQEEQETAAPEETAEAEEEAPDESIETEEPAEGEPGFDSAALAEALSDVCAVAPGSSGSNLRAMKAAGELVVFSATNWSEDSAQAIRDGVGVWFEALDEAEKDAFHQGREAVEQEVLAIVEHPEDPEILGPLEDAGLPNLGLSAMDLTHAADLLDAIRGSTGAVTEND